MAEQNISNNEVDIRKNKIEELKKMKEIPYKEKFERTCTIAEARESVGKYVKIAGRKFLKELWANLDLFKFAIFLQKYRFQ